MGDRGMNTGNAKANELMNRADDYGARAYGNYRVLDMINSLLYERKSSLGMSTAVVAEKTGVDKSFVDDYELGKGDPSLVWIFSYANVVDLDFKIGLDCVGCVDSAARFSKMLRDYRMGQHVTVDELALRMNSSPIDVLMAESGLNDDHEDVLTRVPLSFMDDYVLEAGSNLVIEYKTGGEDVWTRFAGGSQN